MRKSFGIMMMTLAVALAALPSIAQERSWIARETAREYQEQARYPEHSRALKVGETDPVKEKRTATKQTQRGPAGKNDALSVWAGAVSYEVGKPVRLFATVEGGVALEVTGEIVGAAGDLVAMVVYADNGKGVDQKAGDGIWSARLRMPEGLEPELAASYMVKVRSRLLDGDVRESVGGFLYSNPAAHLTGRYRDELRDGNLVIAAEVDVTRSGRFHLAGTLHSLKGEPLGTAQASAELQPGRQWIELSFYGLMFHDRKVAGPYRLGTVSLATTGGMPNALNDLVENAHVTRAWGIEKMTSKPFGNPRLLEAAKRLEN
ncbi:MAG TPA: hypothetical protein VN493_31260 [Thermoanaerobaculia bacterium]|nr:hypothetical protein [Thermoanaerobaculia bacterium]